MVSNQIRPWNVFDERVLDTLKQLRREQFVPSEYQTLAFSDTEIPLPCGQRMLKPIMEGRLLQILNAHPDDRVLLVGAGSGYIAGCIGRLAGQVTALELHAELVDYAAARLRHAQVFNVDVVQADFNHYTPAEQFDRILFTGAVPDFSTAWVEWLAENGQLIITLGAAPSMTVEQVSRDGQQYRRTGLFETVLPALANVPTAENFRL